MGRAVDETAALIEVHVSSSTRLLRDGLALSLGQEVGMAVTSTAGSLHEALSQIADRPPHVAIVDVSISASVHVVRSISQTFNGVKVLAISLPESEGDVIACAEAGAAGYVPRDASLADLVTAIRSVARGEALCSPRIAAALLRRLAARSLVGEGRMRRLTARELEIVELLDEGLSNKEIATRLSIEVATVKNHLHHVFEKLSVTGRAEAAAWLRRRAPRELPSLTRAGT